ncbi:hypothetical protein B4134_3189 [Bacillus safensis]|nr:hypothetical protein B4134_3189 [Bacillus safensis]
MQSNQAKSTDKVEISKKAIEMQKVPNIMRERQDKIDQIKKSIEAGTYQVDTKGIADKMLNFYKQQ